MGCRLVFSLAALLAALLVGWRCLVPSRLSASAPPAMGSLPTTPWVTIIGVPAGEGVPPPMALVAPLYSARHSIAVQMVPFEGIAPSLHLDGSL